MPRDGKAGLTTYPQYVCLGVCILVSTIHKTVGSSYVRKKKHEMTGKNARGKATQEVWPIAEKEDSVCLRKLAIQNQENANTRCDFIAPACEKKARKEKAKTEIQERTYSGRPRGPQKKISMQAQDCEWWAAGAKDGWPWTSRKVKMSRPGLRCICNHLTTLWERGPVERPNRRTDSDQCRRTRTTRSARFGPPCPVGWMDGYKSHSSAPVPVTKWTRFLQCSLSSTSLSLG